MLPDFGRTLGSLGKTGDAMAEQGSPYGQLGAQAFWRSGVRDRGIFGLSDLWASPWELPQDARFATFGSCFAQHISRALQARGMGWINGEPAPTGTPPDLARHYNYGVFSARTANIYSAAHLFWLLQMVLGDLPDTAAEVWESGGRWRDSLRPVIEPEGFVSEVEALASRRAMLQGLRRAVEGADVFIFTLGLTEGWEGAGGQPFAVCPGTLAGEFDPARHHFRNYRSTEIRAQLQAALACLQRLNPGIRLLLTVSPVPLTATASDAHVLVATTRSKSVLRSVAAELAEDEPMVDYFPSYEVITGAPARGAFWEPDLRSVAAQGVELVMGHFFGGLRLTGPARHEGLQQQMRRGRLAQRRELAREALVCEEHMAGISHEG